MNPDNQPFTLPNGVVVPPCPFAPSHDYVVLARLKNPKKDDFKIISKDGTDDRWETYVVGIGPGVQSDMPNPDGSPHLRVPKFKRGDKVVFNQSSSQPFSLFGHLFIICPNLHVFGVVDDFAHQWLEQNKVEAPLITPAQSIPQGPRKHRNN